jgi:hypothetical protein
MNKKNLKNGMITLVIGLLFSTVFWSCSKDKNDDTPSGNTDEDAAARVVGNYKGTLNDFTKDYYNAIIIVTKESGNKVKIAPKSGEVYSNVTTKIIPIQAIAGTDNAASQDPQGILIYTASQKTLQFQSKATATGDVIYNFEGTKQ